MVNNYLKVQGWIDNRTTPRTEIKPTVRSVKELPQIGRPSPNAVCTYRFVDEWIIPFDDLDFDDCRRAADVAAVARHDAKLTGYRDLKTMIWRPCNAVQVEGGSVL